MTSKQLKSKMYYQEKKIIESKLHPGPAIGNGIRILHEHKGKDIVFTVWKGQNKVTEKEFVIPREIVLYSSIDIYNKYKEEFEYLVA
jgi:hypothetical protein